MPNGVARCAAAQDSMSAEFPISHSPESDVPQEPLSKRLRRSPDRQQVAHSSRTSSDGYERSQERGIKPEGFIAISPLHSKTSRLESGPNVITDSLHKWEHDPPPPVSPTQTSCSAQTPQNISNAGNNHVTGLFMDRQLAVFRITNEQLIKEIKLIYSDLVQLETKAIQVTRAQAAAIKAFERGELPELKDHWQELITLHRALIQEHHDFFLASQHVEASEALKELASKYSMAARLWKHGIHSLLELLRYRLPESREFMTSFIYFAYQIMTLLYESVPSFALTWMECAGDLSRYRMAIESEDREDRDIWASTARDWYARTSERCPGVGRLYHHLAILARPFVLRQIYLYSRSLISESPFLSARESMSSVLEPLRSQSGSSGRNVEIDLRFAQLHSQLLHRRDLGDFSSCLSSFLNALPESIAKSGIRWREEGAHIAISICAAMLEYGNEDSLVRIALDKHLGLFHRTGSKTEISGKQLTTPTNTAQIQPFASGGGSIALCLAARMLTSTFRVVLSKTGIQQPDLNVLPHVHVILVFMLSISPLMSQKPDTIRDLFFEFPWSELSDFFNTLIHTHSLDEQKLDVEDLESLASYAVVLPEDHLLRGQVIAHRYLPGNWFGDSSCSEERTIETAAILQHRIFRIVWLGRRLAQQHVGIVYERTHRSFKPRIAQLKELSTELRLTSMIQILVRNQSALLCHYEEISWFIGTRACIIIPSCVFLQVRKQGIQGSKNADTMQLAAKALKMIQTACKDRNNVEIWTASEEITRIALEEPMNRTFEQKSEETDPEEEITKLTRRITNLDIDAEDEQDEDDNEDEKDETDEELFKKAKLIMIQNKEIVKGSKIRTLCGLLKDPEGPDYPITDNRFSTKATSQIGDL